MFPKNAWYVAALPDETPADKPLGRTICDERIAFFRDADGRVAAVEDFCPHRGAPMSLGKVCGGRLQCGYHGLEMDRDGKTVAMPAQRVRGFPAVRRYAVEERHGFIWLWPGDAALATPDTIPHLAWAHDAGWAYGGGLYHVKCDYRLMIDNLMDLTHETYVHSTSIGQKEIDEAPPVTRVDGDGVVTERDMHGVMPPPFWQAGLRANGLPDDQPVDRWQKCRFFPPSNVHIEVGVALAGKGGYDAPAGLKANGIVVDFITPETATTHWYFWGLARHFRADDAALTATTRERQGQIFAEDMEMLERQQLNLSAHPQRALLKLNIDAGGVQARKIIERLCAEEAANATGATSVAGAATKEVA